ncbi:MAG: glycosyltransferase [Bacteroidales bacterium]|nr:glycosyltransferase [Bacteroidales bacterium]
MKEDKTIVHIAYEVAPFFKRGGLGDVASALPEYMSERYDNVVISFYYQGLMNHFENYSLGDFNIEMNGIEYNYKYYYFKRNQVEYYFLNMEDENVFAGSGGISNLNGDNPYKNYSSIIIFLYFGKAVLKLIQLKITNLKLIICHDWHATGIFAYPSELKNISSELNLKFHTSILIHNFYHQGNVYEDIFPYLEDEPLQLLKDLYLKYKSASLLGLAIEQADYVLTVSDNYARELNEGIVPHENLKFLLNSNKKIIGLQNGADYSIWHPERSPYLSKKYNVGTYKNKKFYKKEVFKECGFKDDNIDNTPLILYMCRLTEQKGISLFIDMFNKNQDDAISFYEDLFKQGVKLMIYGNPSNGINDKIHKALILLQNKFKDSFYYSPYYNEENAHNYLAAADIVLLPSVFEPCGLVQLYSMAFGSIPIVRPVGGLKDTVRCFFEEENNATGFYIQDFNRNALLESIKKAVELYKNHPEIWEMIINNAMTENFSWEIKIQNYFNFIDSMKILETTEA